MIAHGFEHTLQGRDDRIAFRVEPRLTGETTSLDALSARVRDEVSRISAREHGDKARETFVQHARDCDEERRVYLGSAMLLRKPT